MTECHVIKPGQLWVVSSVHVRDIYGQFVEIFSHERKESFMRGAQTGIYINANEQLTIVWTNDSGPAPVPLYYNDTVEQQSPVDSGRFCVALCRQRLVWISDSLLWNRCRLVNDT